MRAVLLTLVLEFEAIAGPGRPCHPTISASPAAGAVVSTTFESRQEEKLATAHRLAADIHVCGHRHILICNGVSEVTRRHAGAGLRTMFSVNDRSALHAKTGVTAAKYLFCLCCTCHLIRHRQSRQACISRRRGTHWPRPITSQFTGSKMTARGAVRILPLALPASGADLLATGLLRAASDDASTGLIPMLQFWSPLASAAHRRPGRCHRQSAASWSLLAEKSDGALIVAGA